MSLGNPISSPDVRLKDSHKFILPTLLIIVYIVAFNVRNEQYRAGAHCASINYDSA
jgi:hypothetical protein